MELRDHVLPAVALVLQDDGLVAKSLPLFNDYTATAYSNSPTTPDDVTNYDSPGRAMALVKMDQLVGPLAQNELAIQKILENSSLAAATGWPDDDAKLKAVRLDLLKVLAAQQASLDIINGFVETQRLGDMQHAGEEYISAIDKPDTPTPAPLNTPNPLLQDSDQPGLAPNPYMMDPAAIPGLQVGFNPLSRILTAFAWIRGETAKRENDASTSVLAAGSLCGYPAASRRP
jgi:hypothetical protein